MSSQALLDPEAIKARLRPMWDSGQVLRAWLGAEEDLFPLAIPLVDEVVDNAALEAGCACAMGQGYRIEYDGLERRLCRLVFDRPLDLAAFLGEQPALGELARLVRVVRRRFPGLAGWIREHPQRVVALAPHWPWLLVRLEQGLVAQPELEESATGGEGAPDPAQQAVLTELLRVLQDTGGPDPG